MSHYTTELRYICEVEAGLKKSVGYSGVKEVIEKSRTKIFNFDYPIFDDEYKSVLETKIIKHFYTYEIGEESYGLWKLKLDSKMNEIMPYYNQLYKSQLIEFNPLYTHDLYKKTDGTNKREEDLENREASSSLNFNSYSDTPQGSLNNVRNETYLSSAEKNDNSGNIYKTSDNTINTTDDYLEHTYGFVGKDSSELILKYRKTFINIDLQIINELENLFMQVW